LLLMLPLPYSDAQDYPCVRAFAIVASANDGDSTRSGRMSCARLHLGIASLAAPATGARSTSSAAEHFTLG